VDTSNRLCPCCTWQYSNIASGLCNLQCVLHELPFAMQCIPAEQETPLT